MIIKTAISTCPNDTFAFDALLHKKIDTGNFNFIPHLMDISELNQAAINEEYDVIKVSFNAYRHIAHKYVLLNSGSALGCHNGPVLISKNKVDINTVSGLRIAVPGKYTTANLLLKYAFPKVKHTDMYLFSDIEDAVISGKADAGVLIHENRFTFEERGLHKIADLGEIWQKTTKLLIPLGGIAVKRNLEKENIKTLNKLMRQSVEYAERKPKDSLTFIKQHAVNLSDVIIYKHIKTFVNSQTILLNDKAKKAIIELLSIPLEGSFSPPKALFASQL